MPASVRDQELLEVLSPLHAHPAAPDEVPGTILGALIAALSSSDSHLRDDIAATTLARWIAVDRLISDETMRDLHWQATLAAGPLATLGDRDTDTIFGRSFTLLLLAFLHAADNTAAYLDDTQWQGTVAALARVGRGELDLRAQVPGKGWAHPIAHAADLADELARSNRCTPAAARDMLQALSSMVNRLEHPFLGEEEDRVAVAMSSLISGRHISFAQIRNIAGIDQEDPMTLPIAQRANWKAIARSLYFRVPGAAAKDAASRIQHDLTAF